MRTDNRTEVGFVTAHPIAMAWKQIKTIFKTWMYCRRWKIPCTTWWGVYEKDSENILALTGCLPGSEQRATHLSNVLNVIAEKSSVVGKA